jgi:aldehyde dehydrogenase (NAD+)
VIGSDLADHPDVDKMAFTGSTPIGARVACVRCVARFTHACARTRTGRVLRRRIAGSGKKISLELGGKSPVVVYENADIDSAVEGVVDAIWFNQGQVCVPPCVCADVGRVCARAQVCSAGSRLLVHESIHDRMLSKLKKRVDKFRLGHPLDKGVDMGALVDESQYKTIKQFVDGAKVCAHS